MGRARKMNPTEPGIRTWQVQCSSGVFREPHITTQIFLHNDLKSQHSTEPPWCATSSMSKSQWPDRCHLVIRCILGEGARRLSLNTHDPLEAAEGRHVRMLAVCADAFVECIWQWKSCTFYRLVMVPLSLDMWSPRQQPFGVFSWWMQEISLPHGWVY